MFRTTPFLCLLAITFSSCSKILQYYNVSNNEPSTGCQIKKIHNASGAEEYTTTISYHSNGFPSAVKYETYNSEFDFIDSFTFYYAYDEMNRLLSETSDFVYGPNLIYYAYEGNSTRPVRDTVQALYVSYVEDLEYDLKGRIISKTKRDFQYVIPEDNPGPHADEVISYYYDARGNRQEHMSNRGYPGLIEYSDKPSLYSTHPVWQLIHKNYSRNSVPFGETFNSENLPVSVKQTTEVRVQPFLNLSPGAGIEYDCAR